VRDTGAKGKRTSRCEKQGVNRAEYLSEMANRSATAEVM
jgi:hypothetical protein